MRKDHSMINRDEPLPGYARRKAVGTQFGVLPKGFVSIKSVDRENRRVRAVTSTEQVDRHGDIIMQRGWDLADYRVMPRFLLNHDFEGQPLGKSVEEVPILEGDIPHMIQTLEFAPADVSPLAETYLRFYDGHFLDSFSVGFEPKNVDSVPDSDQRVALGLGRFGVVYMEQRLLEVSSVVIPANPGANQLTAFAKMLKSGDIGSDEMDLLAMRGELRPALVKAWSSTRGRTYYLPAVAEARRLESGEEEEQEQETPSQQEGTDEVAMPQEPSAMALLLCAVEGLQASHKRYEDTLKAIQKGIDNERRRYLSVTDSRRDEPIVESEETAGVFESLMADLAGFKLEEKH